MRSDRNCKNSKTPGCTTTASMKVRQHTKDKIDRFASQALLEKSVLVDAALELWALASPAQRTKALTAAASHLHGGQAAQPVSPEAA